MSESEVTAGSRSTVASVLIGIQAGMAALVAIALFALNADRRRRFAHRFFHEQFARRFGLWSVVFLVVAALLVALAVGVAKRRAWAPVTVYVVEAVAVVASVLRFHPLRSLVGVALAVAVIALVASDSARPTRPPGGEAREATS
jgi:O-antigen ligase